MISEDRLRDRYDREFTHNDPASPYYDGPIIGEDCCEHGVMFDDECEECDAENQEEEGQDDNEG